MNKITSEWIVVIGLSVAVAMSVSCEAQTSDQVDEPEQDRIFGKWEYMKMPGLAARSSGEPKAPEFWIFALLGNPSLGKPFNARGSRVIISLRSFTPKNGAAMMRRFAAVDFGAVICVRWADGNDPQKREDSAPTPAEGDRKIDEIITVLTGPDAKKIGKDGRLWVQFFSEFTGGPGTIKPNEAETMWAWATKCADRIKKEAPYVRICGPALAGVEVLDKDPGTRTRIGNLRHDGLLQGIRWAIKNAEAIDVHLHTDGYATASRWIGIVQRTVRREPGGDRMKFVSWSWSPARYQHRENKEGVRDAILGIWRAMAEAGFPHAAYGGYWPCMNLHDRYQWQAITGVGENKGKPNEPFWTTLMQLGNGQIDMYGNKTGGRRSSGNDDDDGDTGGGDDDNDDGDADADDGEPAPPAPPLDDPVERDQGRTSFKRGTPKAWPTVLTNQSSGLFRRLRRRQSR